MYSFDIFDTLLTRNIATPYGIFLLMQEYLSEHTQQSYSKYLRQNFADLREKAEKNARKISIYDEINLRDIYEVLGQMTEISWDDLEKLMVLEVQTEVKCAEGIPDNIAKVIKLLEQKERVIFISDMYLSQGELRKILTRVSPILKDVPIYVSSEYRCTKQNGTLYSKVREIEGASYSNWYHTGDNYIADVCIPILLGIKADYYKPAEQPLWEKSMCAQFDLKSNCSLQMALGVIQKVRYFPDLNERKRIGMSYGGIILFPYIEWIVNQSLQMGINRLYFIARDGYVLHKIAAAYIKQKKLEIKIEYVYGSRQAWRTKDSAEREKLLKYLEQEIDFSDERIGFVDLNGTGQSVKCLIGLLGEVLNYKLTVFYYAMMRKTSEEKCRFMVYSSSEYGSLLEALCRAPHGTTMRYELQNGKYVPCLAESNAQMWAECGLEDYVYGVLLFTQELLQLRSCLEINVGIDREGSFLLKYCNDTPDRDFVNFIGDMPHDEDNMDDRRYAPKLNHRQLFQLYMWRTTEDVNAFYDGSNLAISLKRLGEKERKLQEFYERNYGRLLGRMIHLFKGLKEGYLVPKFACRTNVILYAAGKEGKRVYHYLRSLPYVKIVGWTDVDYQKYKQQGYPVEPLADLIELKYDILLITIKNRKNAEKARCLLTEIGIEPNRIRLWDECCEEFGLAK